MKLTYVQAAAAAAHLDAYHLFVWRTDMMEYMGIYFTRADPETPHSTPIFDSVVQVEKWAYANGAVDLDITEREIPF